MSESAPSDAAESGNTDAPESHETTARDIRDGDTIHVTTPDAEVGPAVTIARWIFSQQDFAPDTAPEVPTETRRWTDLTGDEPVEHSEVRIRGSGNRSTIATPDGTLYAVVDWIATDDPAYLYLLVMDPGPPEDRRWTSLGPVLSLTRYAPEPEYRPSPLKWAMNRDDDTAVLEYVADAGLAPEGVAPERLRNLARIRGADEPKPLARRDLDVMTAAYRSALAHVEDTGEPIISDSVEDDLTRLDTEFNPRYYAAVFPDGEGGEVVKKRPNAGPPGQDVPPWEVEPDADPTFPDWV